MPQHTPSTRTIVILYTVLVIIAHALQSMYEWQRAPFYMLLCLPILVSTVYFPQSATRLMLMVYSGFIAQTVWSVHPMASEFGDLVSFMIALVVATELSGLANARWHATTAELTSISRLTQEDPEPVLRIDGVGRVLHANPAASAHLKTYAANAEIPHHWADALASVRNTGMQTILEYTGVDGQSSFLAKFVPIPAQNAINVYVTEVSSLRQAQRQISRQEQMITAIIDASPSIIFVKDSESRYVLANHAYCNMHGLTQEQILGATDAEILPDSDLARYYESMDREVLNTGKTAVIDCDPVELADGDIRWLQSAKMPLSLDGGTPDHVLVVAHDISDRVRVQFDLLERDLMLQALTNAANELLTNPDVSGAVKNALRIYGEATGVDRIYIFENQIDENQQPITFERYSWRRSESVSYSDQSNRWGVPYHPNHTRWLQQLERGESVSAIVRDLPDHERALLQEQGIRAIIAVPIMLKDHLWGLVGFANFRTEEEWPENLRSLLNALATSLSGAIARERANQELHQQQEFLASVLDALPNMVWVKDISGRNELFNRTAAERLGTTVSAIAGKTDSELGYPPEVLEQIAQEDAEIIQNRATIHRQTNTLHPTNREFWYAEVKAPLINSAGQVTHILGSAIDITERKRAEEELAAERTMLRSLIDHLPDYIFIKDLASRYEIVNEAHRKLLGAQSVLEPIGRNDFDYFSYDSTIAFYNDEQRVLQTGEAIIDRVEVIGKDGVRQPRWSLTTKVPRVDPTGKISGLIGIARDVTALKAVEEDLRQAKDAAEAATRAKSEFLANMSHEIRTPLNAVIGMTSLLLDSSLPPEQLDYVSTIRDSGNDLLTILNDILDFSKIESSRLELEIEPIDLLTCIDDAFELFRAKTAEKGLALTYVLEPGTPPIVLGDSARLRRMLVNLLSNAIKFTTTGSVDLVVRSITENEQPMLHFAITDTGIGISASQIERIFNPFTQADNSTTRRFGGTGLGLAICRRLCELMGGRIWVESTEGVGSTFHFTIAAPRVDSSAVNGRIGEVEPEKTALVVATNAARRYTLMLKIQRVGINATPAADQAEALRLATGSNRFDLVIIALCQPDVEAVNLIEPLRQRTATANAAIVILFKESVGWNVQFSQEDDVLVLTSNHKLAQFQAAMLQALRQKREAVKRTIFEQMSSPHRELRILVAEDNVVNQKVALRILERLGYSADLVENGVEVLQALVHKAYDIILMDIHMPEMDGIEATRRVRTDFPPDQQPRIVAITADTRTGYREACLAAGMDDYITKPVRIEELVRAMSV